MHLCIVSPFTVASRDQIITFIKSCNAELIIFPGFNASNALSVTEVQNVLQYHSKIFMEFPETGLEEIKMNVTPSIVSKKDIIKMPKQIFSQNPMKKDIHTLLDIWDDRTLSLGNRKFTFIICGEINGFNPDGSIKFDNEHMHDIIVNPCHTIMGHWNYLGSKLSSLSKNSLALHVANNNNNNKSISTDLRIYKNGRKIDKKIFNSNISCASLEI
jgi:hypothetical protein